MEAEGWINLSADGVRILVEPFAEDTIGHKAAWKRGWKEKGWKVRSTSRRLRVNGHSIELQVLVAEGEE